MRSYGFAEELALEGFRISFEAALARVRKASVPAGFSIHSTHTADVDRLLELDNLVRQDVPGSDGWQGGREAFVDDLSDPASYYFAVDDRTGEYAGLVRIWHNPDGPHFGLIGVARDYRHTRVAAALIKCGLEGAAEWGYAHFDTGTSLSNPVMYPRMKRLGAETTWRTLQMIRQ